MQEDKGSTHPDGPGPEEIWQELEQDEGKALLDQMTTDELCARARSRERENERARWASAAALIVFGVAFSYNVLSGTQPWVRLGQAWILGAMCLFAWNTVRQSARRITTNESCSNFLQREFEEERRRLLERRRALVLVLVPGFLASWWGGGPALKAKAWGLDQSDWLFQLSTGPWPFLIVGAALTLAWFAFGRSADKAKREIEDIRRYINA